MSTPGMRHDTQTSGKKRVLLLGASGQVGTELLHLLKGAWDVTAPRSTELDLADADALRRAVRDAQPRWILNAAAYTAVDRAETEPERAHAINGAAPGILGEEAKRLGAAVVHYSTDYVFDGHAGEPRRESDATGPLGAYGASKLAGEQLLAASGAAYFIFRTSWVYSTHGKNFLLTILKLAREREELSIVADQVGAPTAAADLARLTLHTIEQSEQSAGDGSLSAAIAMLGGLYHACGAGETSWFGFAESFIARAQELEGSAKRYARLKPITTAEYPTPAQRPADSRLDCSLLQRRLGFVMPRWEHSVRDTVSALYQGRR